MSCCNDYNPADFTIYQGSVFGPTTDNIAPSIYFRETLEVDGVQEPIDLTGYTAKLFMKPVGGGDNTLTLLSTDSPPDSCLIIDAPDGSVAPYFNPDDVPTISGQYEYSVFLCDPTNIPILMAQGIITVAATDNA